MRVVWTVVDDPGAFACDVLAREAPDIDPVTMRRSTWAVEAMLLREITLAPGLIEAHNAEHVHIDRRERFIAAISEGKPIPPLIVVGAEPVTTASGEVRYLIRPYPEVGTVPFLADGYARYRALTCLGVEDALVVRQRRP